MAPNDPPAIAAARAKTDMDANGVVNDTDFHQFINLAFQVMNYDLSQVTPAIPAAPTSLLVSVAGTLVTLNWTDNSNNELGFTVERQGSTTFLGSSSNVTTVTDQPGPGTWNYRVRSFNNTGTSAWTPFVPVTVASSPTVPSAPSIFNISLSGTVVTLTWADNSNNETSFQIEKNGSANYISVATNATTYSESPGVGTWSYRIRSTNAAGSSSWVGPVSTTINASSSSGWTDLTLPSGAIATFVSNSTGNDANAGTQAAPLKTIAAGYAKLRDGTGDQLLLKRGDTWSSLPMIGITKGGSASNYQVIGAYGTGPRPILNFTGTGFRGESLGKRNIAFIDLDIRGAYVNDTSGIIMLSWRDILIEGCSIRSFRDNIVVQGDALRTTGLKLRRTQSLDSKFTGAAPDGRSQGIYFHGCDNWLIEECVFNRNGIVGSMFSHGVYAQGGQGGNVDNSPGIFINNTLWDNASEGIQLRCGGTFRNNNMAKNSYGAYMDIGGTCDYNTIIGCKDISPSLQRGRGMLVVGSFSGMFNLAGYNTLASGLGNVQGFDLSGAQGTWSNNQCWDWRSTQSEARCFVTGSGVTVNNNTAVQYASGAWCFEGSRAGGSLNKYWFVGNQPRDNSAGIGTKFASAPADPDFRYSAYMTSLGLTGGENEYMARVESNERLTWDTRWTAAGFNQWARGRVGITNNP